MGHIDSLEEVSPGVLRLRGWALDPDAGTSPARLDTYVDGVGHSSRYASDDRPDVPAAYPGMGPAHGFTFDVDVSDGRHEICAYAINAGEGTANAVFCRDVVVRLGPVGHLDQVVPAGVRTVTAAGWTADPDAGTATIEAHVYANSTGVAFRADGRRDDVARVFPHVGAAHGFTGIVVTPDGGSQDVCAYGINSPGTQGGNSRLGRRTVVLPRDVIGHLDAVQAAASGRRPADGVGPGHGRRAGIRPGRRPRRRRPSPRIGPGHGTQAGRAAHDGRGDRGRSGAATPPFAPGWRVKGIHPGRPPRSLSAPARPRSARGAGRCRTRS